MQLQPAAESLPPTFPLPQDLCSGRTRAEVIPAGRPLRLRMPDGSELAIDRHTWIGSAPGADVHIKDPYVSARHCLLLRDGGRTLVRDSSTNGTWLGSARIWRGQGELRPGLHLVVGKTTLEVVPEPDGHECDEVQRMLGESPAMRKLRRDLGRCAPMRWPVLLLGESGTGKELAARAIHALSGRSGRFVAVNCGGLSPELVESELFGHERGAFSGADKKKIGLFEEAEGGTLFLDEIGELPAKLQPKLLRALEQHSIRPVGANAERRVDVRVVSATHQDLWSLCQSGRFRQDLFMRLEGSDVRLPPLRERAEDIPVLARRFLDEIAADAGPRGLTDAALSALAERRWPGNVRELRNVLRQAALASAHTIDVEHLPPEIERASTTSTAIARHVVSRVPAMSASAPQAAIEAHSDEETEEGALFPTVAPKPLAARESTPPWVEAVRLEDLERRAIERAITEHRTARKAAEALGIAKSTLNDKARRYGIRAPR